MYTKKYWFGLLVGCIALGASVGIIMSLLDVFGWWSYVVGFLIGGAWGYHWTTRFEVRNDT